MMSNNVIALFEQLLSQTLALEKLVMNETSLLEEWMDVIEQRGETMRLIDEHASMGELIDEQVKREYLLNVMEIDQRIVSIIAKKKQVSQEAWLKLQRSKQANQLYQSQVNAYGAFFDKKK